MNKILENWEKRLQVYKIESENKEISINSLKAETNFIILKDCINEIKQQLTSDDVVKPLKVKKEIMFYEWVEANCVELTSMQYTYKNKIYHRLELVNVYKQEFKIAL